MTSCPWLARFPLLADDNLRKAEHLVAKHVAFLRAVQYLAFHVWSGGGDHRYGLVDVRVERQALGLYLFDAALGKLGVELLVYEVDPLFESLDV